MKILAFESSAVSASVALIEDEDVYKRQAHGCNSVQATKLALKLADIAITEAGFGADLGAEKFMDIKCRKAGLSPDCIVLVATVRALKYNGGVSKAELNAPDLAALERGVCNLDAHLDNMQKFGVPVVVAINSFPTDTEEEVAFIRAHCAKPVSYTHLPTRARVRPPRPSASVKRWPSLARMR